MVSFNTALDRTVQVGTFAPGTTHTAHEEIVRAGGKALNVARVARLLGMDVQVVGLVGGRTGEAVRALTAEEHIPATWVRTAGETRTCTIVVDGAGQATVVNGSGPATRPEEYEVMQRILDRHLVRGHTVVLAGSTPPGVPTGAYADIVRQGRRAGAVTVVDASGERLRAAAAAAPTVLKVNGGEFAVLSEGDPTRCASRLVEAGTSLVVVTLGAQGAVAFARDGSWRVLPTPIVPVNPTGAGDAFLGALLCGLSDGWPIARCLAYATAAAVVNTRQLAPGISDPEAVSRVAETVRTAPLREDWEWN